jgi:hypothetical protein
MALVFSNHEDLPFVAFPTTGRLNSAVNRSSPIEFHHQAPRKGDVITGVITPLDCPVSASATDSIRYGAQNSLHPILE